MNKPKPKWVEEIKQAFLDSINRKIKVDLLLEPLIKKMRFQIVRELDVKYRKQIDKILQQERPAGWRKGQTIFNFLEWLLGNGHIAANQQARMGDPFHIQDKDWDRLYQQFLKEMS